MTISENITRVREQMAIACEKSRRDPSEVTLIAVSKTHPAQDIIEALAVGVQHFGENRVEESAEKIPLVLAQTHAPMTWHMIGHVQSRKAKEITPLFNVVHSVDTLRLAQKLAAHTEVAPLDVLLEVNVSGEASKSGFAVYDPSMHAAMMADIRAIMQLAALRVRGLMTMAPIVDDMEQTRPVFARLRMLRDKWQHTLGIALPDLSMGMTDDYPIAIQEGATLIRVGRAIFGARRTT
jgi:hypothetical protein